MIKVACALIVKQNKIFLAKLPPGSNHPNQWEFPGGKLKTGESAETGILREITEELEVTLEIIDAMEPVKFDYGSGEFQLIPFLCRIKAGEIKLNEHTGFMWVKWDMVHHCNLPEADRKLLSLAENQNFLKKYFGEKMQNA